MSKPGPLLQRLTHRLSECPEDFLDEPKIGKRGSVHVDAVVGDLISDLGGAPPTDKESERFRTGDQQLRNYLRLTLVASWLLHDEWFIGERAFGQAAFQCLLDEVMELSKLVSAELFVTDPDRREELARLCLAALELRPEGETEVRAKDRLETLSSVARAKVIRETRAKQERARKLRKAMEEKKAREAAAKYNRE